MTEFDPRLQIDPAAAETIAAIGFGTEPAETIGAADYPAALTRQMVGGKLLVRAATGVEVERLLSNGEFTNYDGLSWPQVAPADAGGALTWTVATGAGSCREPAVIVWAGEVLFKHGSGVAGPFFVFRQAAAAWAFSTALDHEAPIVFSAQVVPYFCGRSLAPGLLSGTEADARKLLRYQPPALRPAGAPCEVPLPPFPVASH